MKRLLICAALATLTVASYAQWSDPSNDIPAYNASAPTRPLPPVLEANNLPGRTFNTAIR